MHQPPKTSTRRISHESGEGKEDEESNCLSQSHTAEPHNSSPSQGQGRTSQRGQPSSGFKVRGSVASQGEKKRTSRGSTDAKEKDKKKDKKAADGPVGTFVDADEMKKKVREKLSKPKYAVTDFYWDTGICQYIARHPIFDKLTLFVIFFNAIWIAIDTDMNDEPLLIDAEPQFIIAENFFCLFFSFEWLVRLLSFRRKLDVLKDAWFVFDSFMVSMMVLETWVFALVVLVFASGGQGSVGGNASILRIARLLRLSRMARMGKLLRVMPELMIMIKGMKAATRSVFFTLLLLVVIMYVFAIALVQLSEDTEVGEKYFFKVPEAMYNLMIFGIFLDNVGALTNAFSGSEWVLAAIFLLFILLGALTVMNMLVGVLCEVVSAVAATEQEEMLVNYVNEKISRVMMLLDTDGGGSISKKEFTQILDNVEAVRCLSDVGVDVFALIDLADYIFENDEVEDFGEIELDFKRFMDVVLQLRGSNQATVKDIVDLRKFMRLSMQEHYKQTTQILEKLNEGARLSEEMMASMLGKPYVRKAQAAPERTMANGARDGFVPNNQSNATPPSESEGFYASDGKDHVLPLPKTYDVEGGLLPTLPRETPTGQLLCWIPIASPDVTNYSNEEHLALRGSWSQMEAENLDYEYGVPAEDEPQLLHLQAPAELWQRSVGDFNGSNGFRGTSEVPLSKTLRIPRLHIDSSDAGDDGIVFDDPELSALQRQLETICGQIVTGLNDAIGLAGRTVARRYDEKIKCASASGFANEKVHKVHVQCHL